MNALLSLSRSLPSNGEDDTENTENSELMPIGKPFFDVAPVPIHLSSDDVNAEISRLNLREFNNDLPDSQANPISTTTSTTTTTTIITSKSGAILSTCSNEAPSMPLASPMPKTTPK